MKNCVFCFGGFLFSKSVFAFVVQEAEKAKNAALNRVADLEKEIVRLKKEGSSSGGGGGVSARELRDVQEQLDTATNKLRSKEVRV